MTELEFKKEKNNLLTDFYFILDSILDKIKYAENENDLINICDFVSSKMNEINALHEKY